MEQWLVTFGSQHIYLVYIPVVVAAFFEGPILSIFFGGLLKLGYFSFIPVYGCLMLGDLIGDVAWYYIGFHYGRKAINRFGKRFNITEKSVDKAETLFHKHKDRILFISKITNGFGFALIVLMTAGIVRIPFKRYISINVLGQFIWSGILLTVGYFFTSSFTHISSVFGKASLVAVFLVALTLVVLYSKHMHKKFSK